MEHQVVTDYTNVIENANVKVYVRARPPEDGEPPPEDIFSVFPEEPKKLAIKDRNNRNSGGVEFRFDKVFWTKTGQAEIFDEVCKSQVEHCLKGYNCCCFAYGQTGSGKTYSIFGAGGLARGLIPRSVEYLFGTLNNTSAARKEVALAVSFLEIYCDQIRDLGKAYLDKSGRPGCAASSKTSEWYQNMLKRQSSFRQAAFREDEDEDEIDEKHEIHEDASRNVFVKDLSVIPVTTSAQVIAVVQAGLKLRATHETSINAESSRSHTVFTITIIQKDGITGEQTTGLLNLVDLAGSERLKKSESEGQRLREAQNINSSLSALGKVVMALDPALDSSHIPYRDSKLTRVLQNSIGGNSFTTLLATIHPVAHHAEECMSTLQFANRCRNVQNNPRVNYTAQNEASKDKRIRRLVEEVAILRSKLSKIQRNQTMAVLRQLGIEGTATADGMIQLEDGRVIQSEGDQLLESAETDQFTVELDAADSKTFYHFKTQVDTLVKKNQSLRLKMKENEEGSAKKQRASNSELERMRCKLKDQRKTISDLKRQVCEKDQKRIMEVSDCTESFKTQLNDIVHHNKQLLEQQAATQMNTSVRSTNSVYSKRKIIESARSTGDVDNIVNGRSKAFEIGKAAEVENLRQQYDYWLQKQVAETQTFVAQFNVFVSKKNAQLMSWKQEAAELFSSACDCCRRLQAYAHAPEQGVLFEEEYQFNENRFPLTRDYLERQNKNGESQKRNQEKLPMANIKAEKAVVQNDSKSAFAGPMDLSGDVNNLNVAELKSTVLQLRDYIASGLRNEVETQVLNDLTSHPTVTYIKSLESDKGKYKTKFREEVSRHNDLRVAFNSQKRALNQLMNNRNRHYSIS